MQIKKINIITTLVIYFISSAVFANQNKQYSLFIDAGSSGSRVHVIERQDSSSFPVLTDVFSSSTKPGLSSFSNYPEQAGPSLKKILDEATDYLINQQASLVDTPISVLATAGMRLLSEEQQLAIYANVIRYLKQHYAYHVNEVRTIDGKLEGLYGWLGVNYLLGNFQQHQPTVGSIDMGGASVEMTFATTDNISTGDKVELEVNHQHYTIYSKSILGLGQDQARMAMLSSSESASCFPKQYEYQVNKIGAYQFSQCQYIYQQVIQPYLADQQLPATEKETFVAYSGIYYAYDFFGERTQSVPLLAERIRAVCSLSWDDLQKKYPSIEKKYLANYCANGTYIDELLFHAYQLQTKQLIVTDKLNGKTIDWTLGAALYDALQLRMS